MPNIAALSCGRDMDSQMSNRKAMSKRSAAPAPAAPSAIVPITWNQTGGVVTTASSITRITGSGWGTASAHSNESLTGEAHLRFQSSDTTTNKMIGLTSDPAADANYASIDYAIHLTSTGSVAVWENGISRGNKGAYTPATVLDIDYSAGVLTLSIDGVVVWTSAASVPGTQVWVDSSMNNLNSDFTNIVFSSSPIV